MLTNNFSLYPINQEIKQTSDELTVIFDGCPRNSVIFFVIIHNALVTLFQGDILCNNEHS